MVPQAPLVPAAEQETLELMENPVIWERTDDQDLMDKQ